MGTWKYGVFRKFGTVFLETLLLMGCVLGAYWVRIQQVSFRSGGMQENHILIKAALIALIFQIFLHLNDIYDLTSSKIRKEYILRLCQALVMATVCLSFTLSFPP
jgi:ACR3 family arsenite efflux pump ArsB